MPEIPESARDRMAFISLSTSVVEESTSSAVLSCKNVPAHRLVLNAEEAVPDPGIYFAKSSLPAWPVSFLAG